MQKLLKKEWTDLVDEDDPNMLETLTPALDAWDDQILTNQNGMTILSLLEQWPVDPIMVDVVMPRLEGYQFYQQV